MCHCRLTRLRQWTRRLRSCRIRCTFGGAPLRSVVKHQPTMKRMKRILAGVASLGFGVGAIWFAVGSYRVGRDLAPLLGEMRGSEYATIFTIAGLGFIYLVVAYVFLFRAPRA